VANGRNTIHSKTPPNSQILPKNIILYGPPGTGKTYSSIQYAVSIVEGKPLETIKSEDYAAVFDRYLKYKSDGLIEFTTFHQSFGYEEFIEGIRPVLSDGNKGNRDIEYEVHDGIFKTFCDKAGKVKIPNRVFIIDEINRGNISKIFGELITLIEPTKRIGASEELRPSLPYSGQSFGVPDNVYIIGTMNTADRSIAMMDVALRRRFSFVEMQPDFTLLADVNVGDINIAKMLETLNKRIEVLLDREHTIGHSYLLPLKHEPSLEKLASIFENEIVPLLQEYFYDDYEKIRLVLGDNQKQGVEEFIIKKADGASLFGNAENDAEYYEINKDAFRKIKSYDFLS
jgi:5-methylcytosine-specific restriction endonuclease McrBC GTP-binding regulatory subunit McrB